MEGTSPEVRPLRTLSRAVPLAQSAYERIRRGLAAGGELAGVDRLIEQDLAARFEMSRTPIRDALQRLALMGFLEPSAGGGYVRRSFTVRDAREHYELRVLLEPVAAELAAEQTAAERASGAVAVLSALANSSATDDARFHIRVAELSGNEVLARVIANVVERLVGFGIREAGSDDGVAVAHAHRRIAEAIQAADPRAGGLMARHLEECQNALVADLGGARVPTAVGGAGRPSRPSPERGRG